MVIALTIIAVGALFIAHFLDENDVVAAYDQGLCYGLAVGIFLTMLLLGAT